MADTLKIALAQLNPIMGDIAGNLALLRRARAQAAAAGADLVVATELAITGYPPEDLVLKPMFLEAAQDALEALAADTADGGPGLIVGGPWRRDAEARPPLFGKVFNTAYVIDGGGVTRSEEHTSELQSLMRRSYDVFCLKKKKSTHTKKYSAQR